MFDVTKLNGDYLNKFWTLLFAFHLNFLRERYTSLCFDYHFHYRLIAREINKLFNYSDDADEVDHDQNLHFSLPLMKA